MAYHPLSPTRKLMSTFRQIVFAMFGSDRSCRLAVDSTASGGMAWAEPMVSLPGCHAPPHSLSSLLPS